MLDPMLDLRDLAPEGPRLIRRREFEKLAHTDFFDEDERVELLRGIVVVTPRPVPPHESAIHRLNRLLVLAVGERGWVRVNAAWAADEYSEPVPDLSVVPPGDYETDYPGTAWLHVEVSHSSLRKDRLVKAPLYAECGVPEYWIVNLVERVIEVYTEPEKGRYTKTARYAPGEGIRLVVLSDVEIPVDEVLAPVKP
jgi:Uma2 family endonuclease